MPTRRIFISSRTDKNLDTRRRLVKAELIGQLRKDKFQPEVFWEHGFSRGKSWGFDQVLEVMSICVGAVVLGFPRFVDYGSGRSLVGDYNNFEGAVALTLGLPTLLIAERGVADSGLSGPAEGVKLRIFRPMRTQIGSGPKSSRATIQTGSKRSRVERIFF